MYLFSLSYLHPHLPERTRERDLEGGGSHLAVVVVELFDDELLGVVDLADALLLEAAVEVGGGQLHHQPDANHPSRISKSLIFNLISYFA